MANVFAIANQKGGVGKTTTAINLSAALHAANQRVLLIDIDPQGNATMGCGIDKYNLPHSICELLLDECTLGQAIIASEDAPVDVVGANTDLVAAEVALLKEQGGETKLKEMVEKWRDNYDFVIIDCPPSLNMLTVNAFTASDGVIIPMQCEYYALEGLSSLIETINKIQATSNPTLEICGILRTMFDSRNNLSNEVSAQLSHHFANKVFNTIIPRNVKLAEAPSFGLSAIDYAKSSKGAIAYVELAGELISKTRVH